MFVLSELLKQRRKNPWGSLASQSSLIGISGPIEDTVSKETSWDWQEKLSSSLQTHRHTSTHKQTHEHRQTHTGGSRREEGKERKKERKRVGTLTSLGTACYIWQLFSCLFLSFAVSLPVTPPLSLFAEHLFLSTSIPHILGCSLHTQSSYKAIG